jgi:hypothetical protein
MNCELYFAMYAGVLLGVVGVAVIAAHLSVKRLIARADELRKGE